MGEKWDDTWACPDSGQNTLDGDAGRLPHCTPARAETSINCQVFILRLAITVFPQGPWQAKLDHGDKTSSRTDSVCFLVGWLLNVPATCECISGRICTDNFTCCHTEIEVADSTFYFTQS